MAVEKKQIPIALDNESITKEFARCINCAECVRIGTPPLDRVTKSYGSLENTTFPHIFRHSFFS